MLNKLRKRILTMRRRAAYKIGLDWNMPTLGYLIDHNRDRFAHYQYLDELFVLDPDTYREEVALFTGDVMNGASWG